MATDRHRKRGSYPCAPGYDRPLSQIMTARGYGLLALAVVLLFGFLPSAFAQTVCTLDADAALAAVFAMPTQEVLAQAFGIGLFTPLTGYLVAYYVGLFVNMWKN